MLSKVAQNSAYSNSAVLPITKAAVRRLTDFATCCEILRLCRFPESSRACHKLLRTCSSSGSSVMRGQVAWG
jgi:hypothetical protein